MENTVERRKKFLINLFYYVSILILFFLFLKYAFWICFPFIFALFIGIILQTPTKKISKKTHIPQSVTAVILVILVLAVLGTIIGLAGSKLVSEFTDFANYLSVRFSDYSWIENKVNSIMNSLPAGIRNLLSENVQDTLANLKTSMSGESASGITSISIGDYDLSKILSSSISGVWNTAKQIPSVLVAVLVTIISCCFVTAGYDDLSKQLKSFMSPETVAVVSATKKSVFSSLKKLCKTYLTILCITFLEMLAGLSILSFAHIYNGGYALVISLIVALFDILPVLGTGTFVIPWALYCLLTGDVKLGIGLIVLYIIITVVRQIIEPKLVSGQLELPPIMTIAAMYIGLKTLGVVGMFIMPITLFVIKTLYDDGTIGLFGKHKTERPHDDEKDKKEPPKKPQKAKKIKE